MNNTKFQQVVLLILSVALIALMVFYGTLPTSYSYSVGVISNKDIYATRNFVDTYQTKHDAVIAKNTVSAIFIRSEELSNQSLGNVNTFFDIIREGRSSMVSDFGVVQTDTTAIIDDINSQLEDNGFEFSRSDISVYLHLSSSAFNYIEDKCKAISEIVMMDNVNDDNFDVIIQENIPELFTEENNPYYSHLDLLNNTLSTTLIPNSVFDADATNEAGDNAYSAVMNDPVIVEKGTRLISTGEVVNEHVYQQLTDLELIRKNSFDLLIFVRSLVYVALIAFATFTYIKFNARKEFSSFRVFYTLLLTYLVPVAASLYLSKISGMMALVLFFTTIAATYIGMNTSIVLSVSNMLVVWPLYGFAPEYAFVSFVGIVVCAAIAGRPNRKYNSASLILAPTVLCTASSLAYSFINAMTQNEYIDNAVWSAVSSMLAIVVAIGFMPIYELFSNAVSPVKLIELSQPGHPILKRLFLEASGTYQHCMMVANLADSAAEAVDADALLCKVAAYYHDIGKLENPKFFTENQSDGYNPHDDLSVEESVAIITAHPLDGVKLAKKNKLPSPIVKIIEEHHGTTYPAYFYFKAKKNAEENGLSEPSVDDFRYKGHIPSSKESAIVMIADTCEAAVKSLKTTDLAEVEAMIRKLIKQKIDQDQLIESGLSFDELEKIIIAFKQVYAGVYHERIQYPDGNKNK